MSKPILGYWDLRGIAEPIRLMLNYLAVDYEDRRYVCGDAPEYSKSPWRSVKDDFGLAFPNLPHYLDGDMKITESWAIMKYIARKNNNLLPSTTQEWTKADMFEGVISDFRKTFTQLCYSADYNDKRKRVFEQLSSKLELFERYLVENKWLTGENLTYVDFALAEALDQIIQNEPRYLDETKNVKKYLDQFLKFDKVVAYRKSGEFKVFPINNKRAAWGGNY